MDLSVCEPRYRNDGAGRLAYDPKVLLQKSVCEAARGPQAQSGSAAFSKASSRIAGFEFRFDLIAGPAS